MDSKREKEHEYKRKNYPEEGGGSLDPYEREKMEDTRFLGRRYRTQAL